MALGGYSGRLGSSGLGGGGASLGRTYGRPSQGITGLTRQTSARGSQQNAQLEKKRQTYEKFLRSRGMDPAAARAASKTWAARQETEQDRPSPLLSAVGKVFRTIETSGATALHRATEAANRNDMPWEVAAEFGRGIANPDERMGYGEFIAQDVVADKEKALGRFLSDNSGLIGFGMSLVFDPTMYLSFGATAPSRMAATRLLAEEAEKSAVQAARIMNEKGGWYWGTKYTDPEELMMQVHRLEGRPFDMADTLDRMKRMGLEQKAADRAGERGLLRRATGAVLPTNVKGGRGIRFAGIEVPGTPALGERVTEVVRGGLRKKTGAAAGGIAKDLEGTLFGKAIAQAGVPRYEARLMGEDMKRALALTKLAHFRDELASGKHAARRFAESLVRTTDTVTDDEIRAAQNEVLAWEERVASKRKGTLAPEAPKNAKAISDMKSELKAAKKRLADLQAGKSAALSKEERMRMDLDPPILAYHGTSRDFPASQLGGENSGMGEFGVYFTSSEGAARTYTHGSETGRVLEVPIPSSAKMADGVSAMDDEFKEVVESALARAISDDPDEFVISELTKVLENVTSGKLKSYTQVREALAHVSFEAEVYEPQVLIERLVGESLQGKGYSGIKTQTLSPDAAAYKRGGVPEEEAVDALEYQIWDESVLSQQVTPEHRLSQQINERVTKEIESAKSMKISTRETKELWAEMQRQFADPIEAIAQFVWRSQSKVLSRQYVEYILEHPLFAKPIGDDVLKADVPNGYKIFTSPVTRQKYALMGEMANALDDFVNPVVIDKGTSSFLKMMNLPQNFWKMYATTPNPSFHVMNALGAMFNNLYAGVYNPGDYARALATLYRAKMENAFEAGQTRMAGGLVKVKSTQKTQEAQRLVEEAEIRGGLGRGTSIFAELVEDTGEITGDLPSSVKARLEDIVKRRPTESKKRFGVRQTRRGLAGVAAATGNPLAIALMAPEAARLGKNVGSTVEDIVRLAPFMKASKDPVLLRWMDAYGPVRVPAMKHPGFAKPDQALMYDIGAQLSRHYQFDYMDLTDFERRFAKTLFPFYTYYRKNFVIQAQELIQRPRQIAASMAVINYMNENSGLSPEFRDLLPQYFDNIQAFAVPVPMGVRKFMGLPENEPLFINPKLPFLTLNLFPPVWELFRDTGRPEKEKVMSVLAPIGGSIGPLSIFGAKTMIEATVGEQFGLNKTIDYQRSQSNDWRNSYVPAPAWVKYMPEPLRDFMGIFPWMETVETAPGQYQMTATGQYIIEQMSTPFINNLGHAIPVGGPGFEGEKAKADMVSWLTGIRLIPVDSLRMHRSWAYRLRSQLEGHRQELRDQGSDLDAEEKVLLRKVRNQIEILERSWDRRFAELYPEADDG